MKRFWSNISLSIALWINKAVVIFAKKTRNSLIFTPPYIRLLSASLTERFYAKLLRTLISNMEAIVYHRSQLLWIGWRLARFKRPLGGLQMKTQHTEQICVSISWNTRATFK